MEYSKWIEDLRKEWIGKSVFFEDRQYKVVDVDYNGALLIDKKAQFTETTAISAWMCK